MGIIIAAAAVAISLEQLLKDVYAERAGIVGSERRELVGLLARELAFFDELGNVQRDLRRAPPLDPRWRDDITNSGVTSASGT